MILFGCNGQVKKKKLLFNKVPLVCTKRDKSFRTFQQNGSHNLLSARRKNWWLHFTYTELNTLISASKSISLNSCTNYKKIWYLYPSCQIFYHFDDPACPFWQIFSKWWNPKEKVLKTSTTIATIESCTEKNWRHNIRDALKKRFFDKTFSFNGFGNLCDVDRILPDFFL